MRKSPRLPSLRRNKRCLAARREAITEVTEISEEVTQVGELCEEITETLSLAERVRRGLLLGTFISEEFILEFLALFVINPNLATPPSYEMN